MSAIIKEPFKSFNGVDWDKFYFETEISQVIDAGATMTFRANQYGNSDAEKKVMYSVPLAAANFRDDSGNFVVYEAGNFRFLEPGIYFIDACVTLIPDNCPNHVAHFFLEAKRGTFLDYLCTSTLAWQGYGGFVYSGHASSVIRVETDDLIRARLNIQATAITIYPSSAITITRLGD